MSRTSSALVALITVCLWWLSSCARDDFYDEKVSSLGVTAQLYCNNSLQYPTAPDDALPVSWMLPNLTVLHGDKGRFQLLNNNWTLKVLNVSIDNLGLYYCLLRSADVDWLVMRVGLNAAGPYFEDLWHKYWLNTVRGLSACFSFLLIAVVVFLVNHFCYRSGESDFLSQHDELTVSDGTVRVVGIGHENVEMTAARENWESCASSSHREQSALSCEETSYVADVVQQCHTQL